MHLLQFVERNTFKADGVRAVNRITEISDGGRAPRNDPAIFALALVATHGDAQARAQAFGNLGKVCRIGTHLFHFAEYVNAMRGWGRGLRNAIAAWYVERDADVLAHQAVKYQQREGWSHADLLRLAHPKAPSPRHHAAFRWMLVDRSSASLAESLGEREVKREVNGQERVAKYAAVGELPKLIEAFERVKQTTSVAEVVTLIDTSPACLAKRFRRDGLTRSVWSVDRTSEPGLVAKQCALLAWGASPRHSAICARGAQREPAALPRIALD
jgi:60 kDa SS-A/Ro ribonucleoprotein